MRKLHTFSAFIHSVIHITVKLTAANGTAFSTILERNVTKNKLYYYFSKDYNISENIPISKQKMQSDILHFP